MELELLRMMIQEFDDSESLEELMAMVRYGHGYESHKMSEALARNRERLEPRPLTERQKEIARLEAELAQLKKLLIPQTVAPAVVKEVAVVQAPRVMKKYKLLSKDVGWAGETARSQIHAVMAIISAHAEVGDVLDEADIVRMMEANVRVLDTVQPPKRIWDYYKGRHYRGLIAHGNLEEVR